MPRYKVLKSVAHNVGHSFLSDMNTMDGFTSFVPQQLFDVARKTDEDTVTIDFLKESIEPKVFEAPHIVQSLQQYRAMLEDLVVAQGAEWSMVRGACLTLRFHPPGSDRTVGRRPKFECIVEIVDDRGIAHRGTPRNWWSDPMGGLR